MNQITTQEFDYSWCRKNSTKVALIDGGRKIQKKATDHAMLTMDLAEAYYEQKRRLVDAALNECDAERGVASAVAQELKKANYSLEDLLNEKAAASTWIISLISFIS